MKCLKVLPSSLIHQTTVLLLAGMLTACVGAAREPVENLTSLGGGETLVVGRVELVPPLAMNEQKIEGIGTSDFKNKIFLITDEKFRELEDEPVVADFTGRIEATIGKNFFVRSDSKPFYILAGMFYLELRGRDQSKIYFPGNLKATLKPGDKAVYIGTIQYHRDEFFDIKKVVIVDDYEKANSEFRKTFGANYSLRKALLTKAK
jgi:hypothetical protein